MQRIALPRLLHEVCLAAPRVLGRGPAPGRGIFVREERVEGLERAARRWVGLEGDRGVRGAQGAEDLAVPEGFHGVERHGVWLCCESCDSGQWSGARRAF